jgi:hypothetical protein
MVRISLLFALGVQVLHMLYGYAWWVCFSTLGVWTLCVPVSTTYSGAAVVLWDERRGIRYTGWCARLGMAAFLGGFFLLCALALVAVLVLAAGRFGWFPLGR